MKSREERITEFIKYHSQGDGECNNDVLKYIADKRNMSFQNRCDLSYFFAVTYCVASALIVFDLAGERKNIKEKLIFQSDRKYVAMGDRYEKSIAYFEEHLDGRWFDFLRSVSVSGKIDLERGLRIVQNWFYFGRFAAYLFLETFICLNGFDVINNKIEWKNGDTATSGLLNIFAYDNSADYFDKKNRLPEGLSVATLDEMFEALRNRVKLYGADTNTVNLETSMCAYRKFYKGSRYNGYYLDRMLEETEKIIETSPSIFSEILNARAALFDSKMLGEKTGWNGIRVEMKKYYLKNGVINDIF